MIYTFLITVPPQTHEASPIVRRDLLTVPYIRYVKVNFRDGCLMAVGVRFLDNGSQFAPWHGWLFGNNETILVSDPQMLEGPPYTLVTQAINYAVDYPHTLYISLEAIGAT